MSSRHPPRGPIRLIASTEVAQSLMPALIQRGVDEVTVRCYPGDVVMVATPASANKVMSARDKLGIETTKWRV